ncbi:MAG TPA: glycosyltransferase family 4 protein [Acidimicrobiales bacterium]|nr:glycosyltransferase family 4 protein [Acidimicrobiales bacterium]
MTRLTAAGGDHWRFAFVLEQSLGNVVQGRSIERAVAADGHVDATLIRIEHGHGGLASRLPALRSWSFEASMAARRALRERLRQGRPDAVYIHTQVSALLSVGVMRRVPTVISLDATPINFDQLAASYGHRTQAGAVEAVKRRINRRALAAAEAIVTYSDWAADSVTGDYGIPADRVHVIPVGVDLRRFRPGSGPRPEGPPRVLFVGGDFARKGGPELLDAMRRLDGAAELDIVTPDEVAVPDGLAVRVHRGLTHDSDELYRLYREADIFAFPTHGDCLPNAVCEAVASGLPVVATGVGAIGEVARNGRNGLLVPPGDAGALAAALRTLVEQPELRRSYAEQGLELARRRLDAERNGEAVLDLLRSVSRRRRTMMLVSADGGPGLRREVAEGTRPTTEYLRLEQRYGVRLHDWSQLRWNRGRRDTAQTLAHLFSAVPRLRGVDAVLSDGEHLGIPLALLLRPLRGRAPRHVVIGHDLVGLKKALLLRTVRPQRGMDSIIVHSSNQVSLLTGRLGVPPELVHVIPYAVDTGFWFRPDDAEEDDGLVVSVGREHRDYRCLAEACAGERVFVADHSLHTPGATVRLPHLWPASFTHHALNLADLRAMYARASVVVVPVLPSDPPFGITTVLEAMSMGRALVISATAGLAGVIEHERTGLVVPPEDPGALRAAVRRLLDDPAERQRLGKAARAEAERLYSVDRFVDHLAHHLGLDRGR